MKVFQVTLVGWRGDDATPASEACIKWVKCSDRNRLNLWIVGCDLDQLVRDIDDNPPPEWGFDDGVDVILTESGGEEWSPSYGGVDAPLDVWRETVQKACAERIEWLGTVKDPNFVDAGAIGNLFSFGLPADENATTANFDPNDPDAIAEQLGLNCVQDKHGKPVYPGTWLSSDSDPSKPPVALAIQVYDNGQVVIDTNPKIPHRLRPKSDYVTVGNLAACGWVRSNEQPEDKSEQL